jgi:hypothetical protein
MNPKLNLHIFLLTCHEAILRDCMPTSPFYSPKALSDHLVEIGLSMDTVESFSLKTKEDCREEIHEMYIAEKQIWFQSFKAGVTLDGKRDMLVGCFTL